jgi:flagellar biosynthetic protein FliQ
MGDDPLYDRTLFATFQKANEHRGYGSPPSRGRQKENDGVSQMTGGEVLDVARDAIWTIVLVSSPLMLVGLVVGVVISLIQALTQIQEMTLAFVPKILAIFVTLLLALPFMADVLHGHMMRLSARIAAG